MSNCGESSQTALACDEDGAHDGATLRSQAQAIRDAVREDIELLSKFELVDGGRKHE